MTRSTKKAIVQVSHKIDKGVAHKQVRRRVHVELEKEEPDINILEADTRQLGLEEWGTKFGMEFDPAWDDDDWGTEYKIKSKRK